MTLAIIVLFALLLASALFSASETALVTMSRHRLKTLKEEHPARAGAIDNWLTKPNNMLTSILIGLNGVNLLAAILTDNITEEMLGHTDWPSWTGPVISFGLVSFVIIAFCEILPKMVGYNNSDRVVIKMIKPISTFHAIVSPIGKVFVAIANLTLRIFTGKSGPAEGPFITQSEILGIVDDAGEQGVIDKTEREMIRSVVEFGETQVREVMTPRPDMRMAPADTTVDRMAVLMEEQKHSRIPIYEGGEDNVIGVVNSRTLLRALKDGRDSDPVKNYVHKAYFVPESKMVDDLLHDFQKKRTHLAIVIDEYGCTAGLVTIEDLLEEIVGEIWDEYDTEEPLYRWVDSDTLRVDARIDIAELNDILDAEFNDDEEFETLGGLIFHTMGKVPKQEETVDIDGYEMKVERMVGRRIASVIIKRPSYPGPESENGEK